MPRLRLTHEVPTGYNTPPLPAGLYDYQLVGNVIIVTQGSNGIAIHPEDCELLPDPHPFKCEVSIPCHISKTIDSPGWTASRGPAYGGG